MASLEGDNLVAFYLLSASELWPDKRGDFCDTILILDSIYNFKFRIFFKLRNSL